MSELNFELLQENIRALLKKHDLTQNDLATIAGMTQANVSKALNPGEKKQFTIDQVFRISQHFGVSIDELVGNKAADKAATSPRAMLALITKLLCEGKIRIVDVKDEMETVYTPFTNSIGYPDCSIDKKSCDYYAFYFPDYVDPKPGLDEIEMDDFHFSNCYDGNASAYQLFNVVLKKILPMIKLYRETEIPDEAFKMVLNGYLEQLSKK